MPEEFRPQLDIDLAAGIRKNIGANARQYGFEQCGKNQADGNHVERLHGVIDQYLVHHYLKEHWSRQADELQHQRNQQYFTEQLSVFDHRGNEPGEVKLDRIASIASL